MGYAILGAADYNPLKLQDYRKSNTMILYLSKTFHKKIVIKKKMVQVNDKKLHFCVDQ